MIQDFEFPKKIRLTEIRMKATTALFDLRNKNYEDCHLKLTELLASLESLDKRASDWQAVLFQIANKIS